MKVLNRLFGRRQPSSSEVARERLQFVLSYDRANISPGLLDTLKDEIIAVISRHISIDPEGVEITFSEGSRESRLEAHIPLATNRGGRKK
ncbi:MAG: cell division topological specificity factor MinE [Anaerolineae bacterium]|nr:cell division topological specificity factor MinE [Anaerolineae bacterium]